MDQKQSPFRSWNNVEPFEFVDGVHLHAIGGEQVLLCRVAYEPGKKVPLHSHADTEQAMMILDGEVDMAIEGEWRRLRQGDVVVVNRGLTHELVSENGVTFWGESIPDYNSEVRIFYRPLEGKPMELPF